MKKYFLTTALLTVLFTQNACQKEYLNPSIATEQQIVNSTNGLITLVNGLQYRYTIGRLGVIYNAVAAGGLTTRELRVLNAGNTDELFLEQGSASVQGSNAVVRNLWASSQLVRSNADVILANADRVIQDPGTKSGVVAYASIFKALALGTLTQFFEQTPTTTGNSASFVPRAQALQLAVQQLEAAAMLVAATPPSATFNSAIVPGIDIANTLRH